MLELIAFGGGTLLLLAALIYGVAQYNRRNRANATLTDAATRELYQNPERYEDKTKGEIEAQLR